MAALRNSTQAWVAAVDAFGAADRMRTGEAEGGFILRYECISRVIKFDSKQTKHFYSSHSGSALHIPLSHIGSAAHIPQAPWLRSALRDRRHGISLGSG
jgi:hypothetical protein